MKARSARVVSSWMSERRSVGQRGMRLIARVRAKVMPKLCCAMACLALVDGVGLLVDLEGAADLDEGGAGEGVVREGVLGGEVVELVAGVGVELEGVAEDRKSGNRCVGVDDVESGMN